MTLGQDFPTILEAARSGAEWAWTAIYRDLAGPISGYLRGRGASDPDDLTGEVFLQIVRSLHKFEGDERDFRAWVFTLAHNRSIDDARRRARRPVDVVDDEVLERHVGSEDPTEWILDRLTAGRIETLIGRLSPAQRDVVLLRLLGGLSVDEVAGALGKRPGAVKVLQHRGLIALRKEISKEGVTL